MVILLCGSRLKNLTPDAFAGTVPEAYQLLRSHGEALVFVAFPGNQGVEFAVTASKLYRDKKFYLVTDEDFSYDRWIELEQEGITPVKQDDIPDLLAKTAFKPRAPVPEEYARVKEQEMVRQQIDRPVDAETVLQGLAGNCVAVYVVCPSQPAIAGETAVAIAKQVSGSALVCAGASSVAALAIGILPETLVTTDWRIPGSNAPVNMGGVYVWPVDPLKFLVSAEPVHKLVERVKTHFPLVVVDCGGSLDVCTHVWKPDVVALVRTGDDLMNRVAQHWLEIYGQQKKNIIVLQPGSVPDLSSLRR